MNVAFLFPGQGSQVPGMLHTLPDHPTISRTLDEVSETLKQNVLQLDSPEALRSTASVQLALLASGVAVARALVAEGVEPEAVAGMSAGAFAAAVAAGVPNLADGVRLMKQRAERMVELYPKGYPQPSRLTKIIAISLIVVSLGACQRPAKEPVTLTFLDPEWSHDLTEGNVLPDERLQEFMRQTGIRVKHLPAPETALDQLGMALELLRKGSSSPDVSGVDVIWPGTLSEDLIDLKPYFVKELSSVDPDVVASYTVKGKLVAVPYIADIGVLFYRKDLLREYGYGTPPRTWDQLEKMAARIQQGERAKGQKDFWGFVWPGAAGEGLTCNGLEWQVGEGGGRIIEGDSTISVNNPDAIRSWQRAAHWIGRISSPSVISYEEWDAINAFYLGKAAFYRGWARSYFLSVEDKCGPALTSRRICGPAVRDRIGISSVPDGKAAQVSALGGFGLGVSRSAAHPAEALELVRFLVRREMQFEAVRSHSESPLEQLEWPAILKTHSGSADIGQHQLGSGVVSRPTTVSGQKYEDVSHAYIGAVHSVLMGKTSAPQAAAGLEKELVGITSFKTGPPSRIRGPKD